MSPLNWTVNSGKVSADLNKGAVFNNNLEPKLIPNFCSAEIKDGGLVVEPKDTTMMTHMPFGAGVYHVYDYSLFFENLKENIAERIKTYLLNKSHQ